MIFSIRRTLSDALARLPPDLQQIAQQQINTETNAERRKQIALSYIQNHRMRVNNFFIGRIFFKISINLITYAFPFSVSLNKKKKFSEFNKSDNLYITRKLNMNISLVKSKLFSHWSENA